MINVFTFTYKNCSHSNFFFLIIEGQTTSTIDIKEKQDTLKHQIRLQKNYNKPDRAIQRTPLYLLKFYIRRNTIITYIGV